MATSENYIKQIQANNTTYDIAVAHGLTFTTGKNSQTWDGVSDVTVVIPTLSDLIADPIRFAGTVGSDGIAKKSDSTAFTPAKGDLVFITADCTFNNEACEAGDMAVYDGSAWQVVSGENNVTIKNATPTSVAGNKTEVELTAVAKTVLDVEGKELALKLPAGLLTGITPTKNAAVELSLLNGKAAVDTKYITLTYTSASEDITLGSNSTVAIPTALSNGAVTFSGDTNLVKASDIATAWTAGTDGAHTSASVEFAISGNVNISLDANGTDFVTGWDPSSDNFVQAALKSASLKVIAAADKAQDEAIAVNSYIATNPSFSNDATLFGTSISAVSTGEDFTIPGAVSVSAETSKAATNGVIVDVILPTIGDDSNWTDVNYATADSSTGIIATIADPSVTINGGNVIAAVSVSNNVLVVTPGTVTASATQGAVTYKKAQYKKTVLTNTPSVSYGSIQTAAGQGYKLETQAVSATFTEGTVKYFGLETANVSASDKAAALTGLTASKAAYTGALAEGATGTIASGTVITGVTDAVVPTLATVTPTGSITGSVATTLSTSNVTVGTFSETSINIGTWALGSADVEPASGVNYVEVGVGGNANVTGSVSISANTFVSDITSTNLSVNE